MLRMAVPVMAERQLGFEKGRQRFRSKSGGREVRRRIRAGPRSCGKLTRKCW